MSFKNHIVLVGLPGVGKTSIGKRLSKMLDEIHVDIDKEIQAGNEKLKRQKQLPYLVATVVEVTSNSKFLNFAIIFQGKCKLKE